MKKLLLVIYMIITHYAFFSQEWTSIGLNLSYQGNKLIGNNLKQDDAVSSGIKFNSGISFFFGFNTNEFFQISIEAGFAKINNSLEFLDYDTVFNYKGERKISLNTFNVGLILRGYSQGGYYIEGGLKYYIVSSAYDKESTSLYKVDATYNFSNYLTFVGGIGILAYKTQRANLIFGFRGEYNFTDLINDYGKGFYYPTYKNYDNNDKISYISGMIIVNLTYDIGILNDSRQTYRYSYYRD